MHTEAEKMACTWFGEIPSSCSLTVLLGPAWVLLKYCMFCKPFFGPCRVKQVRLLSVCLSCLYLPFTLAQH